MYHARKNEVHWRAKEQDRLQLFLVVHPTTECTKTPAEQATILAEILNDLQPVE